MSKVFFHPKYPVVWFAEYHSKIKKLKIPKCKTCDDFIQVTDYNNVVCGKCKDNNITWDVEDGAIILPVNHFLLEFDEHGNETINYKYLPMDGLLTFGLLDPSTSAAYGIDLLSGYITIRDFTKEQEPFYLATGINTNAVPTNLIKVSDAIIKGEAKLKLYHSKQVLVGGDVKVSLINLKTVAKFEMHPNNLEINNIAVGYSCEIDDLDFEVVIRIDCNNHLPYFTSKATPKKAGDNL